MRTAKCLQHVAFEGPALYEEALGHNDFYVERSLVPKEGLPDTPGDFLLVIGGPMSANDTDPWIREEIEFIRKAVERGIFCVGVCLGAQLLAKALGGDVKPGPRFELGISTVRRTEEGKSDPIFSKLPDPLTVFQWHGDGIVLPKGAVALAASDDYPVQAFRWKQRAYGFLFHLEQDDAGVARLCESCPQDLARAGKNAEQVQAEAKTQVPIMQDWAHTVIDVLSGDE